MKYSERRLVLDLDTFTVNGADNVSARSGVKKLQILLDPQGGCLQGQARFINTGLVADFD